MADYTNLKDRASEIRTEVKIGANTAQRVGYLLEQLVSAIEANTDAIDTNTEEISKRKILKHYQETDDQVGISVTDDNGKFAQLIVSKDGIFLQRLSGKGAQDIILDDNALSVSSDMPIDLSGNVIKLDGTIPNLLEHIKKTTPVAVEKFVMEAMQNNGTWDKFMAENPLIYVAE